MVKNKELGLCSAADRDRYDRYFYGATSRLVNGIPLPKTVVERTRERFARNIYDSSEHTDALGRKFPSGTFLFHGATTSHIVKILNSGYLMNAHAIDASTRGSNGGSEGVSWSLSEIEAVPGTRYHIAGFVAPPEAVLGKNTQLAVPDKPAPFEVVQLSKNIDAEWYYDEYKEMWALEKEYREVVRHEGRDSDRALALRRNILGRKAVLDSQLSARNDVRIPVDKLHMIAAQQDIDVWIEVLARCPVKPAGIITYDSDEIWREDFASGERGHGAKLTECLRRVISDNDQTIRFSDVFGGNFDDTMRDRSAEHIIDSKYLANTKRIVLEGKALAVV